MSEERKNQEDFADLLGYAYENLKKLCECKKIPFPEGTNFDGLLRTKDNAYIPIEHTRDIAFKPS